jgi:hypothetical protein
MTLAGRLADSIIDWFENWTYFFEFGGPGVKGTTDPVIKTRRIELLEVRIR